MEAMAWTLVVFLSLVVAGLWWAGRGCRCNRDVYGRCDEVARLHSERDDVMCANQELDQLLARVRAELTRTEDELKISREQTTILRGLLDEARTKAASSRPDVTNDRNRGRRIYSAHYSPADEENIRAIYARTEATPRFHGGVFEPLPHPHDPRDPGHIQGDFGISREVIENAKKAADYDRVKTDRDQWKEAAQRARQQLTETRERCDGLQREIDSGLAFATTRWAVARERDEARDKVVALRNLANDALMLVWEDLPSYPSARRIRFLSLKRRFHEVTGE